MKKLVLALCSFAAVSAFAAPSSAPNFLAVNNNVKAYSFAVVDGFWSHPANPNDQQQFPWSQLKDLCANKTPCEATIMALPVRAALGKNPAIKAGTVSFNLNSGQITVLNEKNGYKITTNGIVDGVASVTLTKGNA